MLCPNLTDQYGQFQISGNEYSLGLNVYSKGELSEEILADTLIFSEDVTRFFDPHDYLDKGYAGAVSLTQDLVFPIKG